jgi:hypothetical protein
LKYFETVAVKNIDELFCRGWIGITGDYFFLIGKGDPCSGWYLRSATVEPTRDFDRQPIFSKGLTMSLLNYGEVHLYHHDNPKVNQRMIAEVFEKDILW